MTDSNSNFSYTIKDYRLFAAMRRDLTEPTDKAKALVYDSGLSKATINNLSGLAISTISILRQDPSRFDRMTAGTRTLLATGYDNALDVLNIEHS